jgi:putative ABC transport system permease protein
MNLLNVFRVASRSLGRNKMRSFLTILGIIIGVAAVIAMMAIGEGAQHNIQQSIASLGTNVLIVFPGSTSSGGVRMGAGTAATLTLEDADAIAKQCPAILAVTPIVRAGAQVVAGEQNWSTAVWGATPTYFTIRDWPLSSGLYFTDQDNRSQAKVCVIGQTVAQNLFGDANPVGSVIRIRKLPFKVIGVLAPKGQSANGQDLDDIIVAPFLTVQRKILGTTNIGTILASARSSALINEAQNEITELLRVRHRIPSWGDNDFTVRTQTEIANAAESTSRIMTILLASIASVSLIVGGIGIMNIMLVSVTERTREIGIRMAVGARSRDVLYQFLIEATVLSVFGGIIGIILGMITSEVVSQLAGWPVLVSPFSVLLAFLFSMAVGIFFGFYPARKAALLNPIEALRYE